jgi:hypothetical protein
MMRQYMLMHDTILRIIIWTGFISSFYALDTSDT